MYVATKKRIMHGNVMLLAGLALLLACNMTPAPSTSESSGKSLQLSMPPTHPSSANSTQPATDPAFERALDKHYGNDTPKKNELRGVKSTLDAQLDAELKLAEINRQTMVVPAPINFKPEPVDRKIQLKLILEKTEIRPGDFLRYRLEMTNVGRQPIDYEEYNSGLFKYGGLHDTDRISFYITDPRGRREKLDGIAAAYKVRDRNRKHPESKLNFLPDSISKKDKEKWLAETTAMSAASTVFAVELLPGETLRSRGDGESIGESFRTLWCEQEFERTGRYELEVVLDDRPRPLSKSYIEFSLRSGSTLEQIQKWHDDRMRSALGPKSSNVVTFEVMP